MTSAVTEASACAGALTPYEAHVQRLVAAAPPLVEEQRVRLRALFRGLPQRKAA